MIIQLVHKLIDDNIVRDYLSVRKNLLSLFTIPLLKFHLHDNNNRHFYSAVYLDVIFRGAFMITPALA